MRVVLAFIAAAIGLFAIFFSLLMASLHEGESGTQDTMPDALLVAASGVAVLTASLWSLQAKGRRAELIWLATVIGLGLGVLGVVWLVA